MSSSAVTLGVTPRQRNSEFQATGQAQVWHVSVTGTFLCLGSEGCVCVCVLSDDDSLGPHGQRMGFLSGILE